MDTEIQGRRTGYANLTNDYMFKRLFGSEDCKEILIAFLRRVIPGADITDVRFNDKEFLGMTEEDSRVIVDISCITSDGSHFIVEMQKASQAWFRDRAIFYTSYPIMGQKAMAREEFRKKHHDDRRFRWNFCLSPVRLIAIANFRIDHGPMWPVEKYHSTYRLREDEVGEPMSDKLTYTFLELGLFDKTEEQLETPYDKWMYLFKNMATMNSRPDSFQEKEFELLFEKAELANFTSEQYEEYQRREIMEYDYENCLDFAHDRGLAEGIAQGREEGREEGRDDEKVATARRMLLKGMSIDLTAELSGLPIDRINLLATES
ncbi:MAG: Rpn family recombination-promoting nuclease/putative transposase [Candidatus Cryptobacteroides sp.]